MAKTRTKVKDEPKVNLKTRDELDQRSATYKKYHEGVSYEKMGTEDMQEIVGTVYYNRLNGGKFVGIAKFKSAEELEGAIDAYWQFLMDAANSGRTIIPDVEGLASFIGVARSTLLSWKAGKTNKDFAPVMEKAFNDIASANKQLAKRGKIPPIVAAMDFNNNHGYTQNQKVDIDITARREPMTIEQLTESAKMLPG